MPDESTDMAGRSLIAGPGTRGRVLSAIRAAPAPIAVDDLALELGLHPNSVRFHAGALEADGLVRRGRRPTGGKGRPRTVYSPTAAGARSGQRNYELLAGVLVEHLLANSTRPLQAARAAGRSWANTPAVTLPASGRRSAVRAVFDVLDDMAFEPEARPAHRPTELHLHNCPFRELVDTHQEIVCAVHLGLIEGLLDRRRVADSPEGRPGVGLTPFAEPGTCIVHLDTPGR